MLCFVLCVYLVECDLPPLHSTVQLSSEQWNDTTPQPRSNESLTSRRDESDWDVGKRQMDLTAKRDAEQASLYLSGIEIAYRPDTVLQKAHVDSKLLRLHLPISVAAHTHARGSVIGVSCVGVGPKLGVQVYLGVETHVEFAETQSGVNLGCQN